VRRVVLLEALRYATWAVLRRRRRLLLVSIARRSSAWCGGSLPGVRRILLPRHASHWALRYALWERVLPMLLRWRLQRRQSLVALQSHGAGRRAKVLRWRGILRRGLLRRMVGEGWWLRVSIRARMVV